MSEFEDMLGGILNDPKQMGKIAQMASQLFGGEGGEESSEGKAPDLGFDPGMLGKLSGLLSSQSGGDKTALLKALAPYLKPERRARLEKAMRISRMARLAGIALEEQGEGHV